MVHSESVMSPEAQTPAEKTTPRRSGRKIAAAAGILAAAALAAAILALFTGAAKRTAVDLVRALAGGDGQSAAELLPEEVVAQVALENGTDSGEAAASLADRLSGAVAAYGKAPETAGAKASGKRELSGEELEELREVYGQIGAELSDAVIVDVDVIASGASGTVPVRVIKLGFKWYADYTSLDDTAYEIAYIR